MANPEFLITIPQRGLRIIPPAETARNMAIARDLPYGGSDHPRIRWSEREKTRLWLMKNCKIMANRYPTAKDGQAFMEEVDFETRNQLLATARNITQEIAASWNSINPNTPIAIILFGSIAKGLVKRIDHPDPSNIDLAVIGDISDEERQTLLESIRPARDRVRNGGEGDTGVIVQNIERVSKNNFSDAINYYIASGAVALYDPAGIWSRIEAKALDVATEKRINGKMRKNTSNTGPTTIWFDGDDPRSQLAMHMLAETGIPTGTGIRDALVPVDTVRGVAYTPPRKVQ